ncbi:MAG: ATP-binding protein [Oscillospiraceae bacterium]|nr:ATP-binding protein [Oscillospiraceae bacterium]
MTETANMKKKLPVGIEDFAEIITQGFYYVDKTGMIKELLENWGKVNLFTRPRRFGKSLNMSMLKYFFEIGTDKKLFSGLAISKETELCEKYMGQYPVISITLKATEAGSFETSRNLIAMEIRYEAERMSFLAKSDKLTASEKKSYDSLLQRDIDDETLYRSLKTLSALLQKHYGKKVVILIDEYDVPLAKASKQNYYKEMVLLIRNLFEHALKTNSNLEFAVLTGCLRVSKESIFTGLNNTKLYTLLDARCDGQFGFTDKEVREMLAYFDLGEYYSITKEWYDGYKIGRANVYNPWDVINWCDQLLTNPNKVPKSYWANSSSNEEVQKFIQRMGNGVTKAQIERLISGETVQKKIEEQLTYDTMYDSVENMWSLLYATGYLTQSETPSGDLVRLAIPNTEVRSIFMDFVLKLFENSVAQDRTTASALCEALKSGNAAEAERLFTAIMKNTISIRDTAVRKEFKESFYHGLLLGILGCKDGWSIDSNRESGNGYYDIAAEIEDEEIGIVIEVKYAENAQFEKECKEALKQIDDNDYTAALKDDGMRTLLKYAVACYKKSCMVVCEKEELESEEFNTIY